MEKQTYSMKKAEDQHEGMRGDLARQQWIRWRMADVPAIYCQLMPPTYCAQTLYTAELCIRAMLAEDQKLLQSPWRKIGPRPQILMWDDMDPDTRVKVEVETRIPIGFKDRPKDDRLHDPEVEQERERARGTAEYKAAKARADLWEALQNASRSMADALERHADEATLEPIRSHLHAMQEKWNSLSGNDNGSPFFG
jgi:hypothetical protein